MLAIVSQAADFKDFSVIVNNQDGTLLTADEQVQGTAINFGVAVADDGTTTRVAADDANAVATVSGNYHSEHGCTALKVVVPNAANVKITVGQCTYSPKAITVTDADGNVVASKTPSSPACWKNDRNNVDQLYYVGDAKTLTITGMDYCPYVAVSALTEDEIAALNAPYTLTYYNTDGNVLGTQEVKGQDPIAEFKYGASDVTVEAGSVFRGWFNAAAGGKKYKTTDLVTDHLSLYAVATAKEVADNKSSYAYNLADANFDPADHECIEIVGDKAYWHDASHGWALYNDEQIKLQVGGDATITVVNCQYGHGTNIAVKNEAGETIGSLPAKSDADGGVATYEYKGEAATLSLVMESGGEMYLHSVSIANHSKATSTDVTANWSWQTGTPASIADVHIEGTTGTVASDVEGIELAVDATSGKLKSNGDNVQFNNGTIIRVPVVSSNDVVTVVAHPYNFTEVMIGGNVYNTETTEYKATAADAATGFVIVQATTNFYLYSISVVQKAPKGLATLDNEPATATFTFNGGTEGQKADFAEAADYFVTSKVTYGSNLTLYGANSAGGVTQTLFMPETQQNEGESGTAADETNAIRFLIQPNYGLTFTPTKVSLKTTRYGTDNGLLDFAWENPDKTTVLLEQGVKPARNNGSPTVTEVSYNIEGATPGEGTCGLLVNLYHLQNGKQIGFADIVIEGTLSGTEKEVPVLATMTINGQEFTAEALFDDAYEAEFEMTKKATMISASNPVTVTAKKGDLGTVTYDGDETKCKVTVPMTFGETTVEYVLNIVQKPDFKLTYIDTDKSTVLGEFTREKDETIGEFDLDLEAATAPEGQKVRGWYLFDAKGKTKYSTETVITGDITLNAVATDIEVVSTHNKYTFDLTDKTFEADEHEAFNPSGDKFYWHDTQHGWAFSGNNKIDLLVGPKATVSVTLCRYGTADDIVITENGKEIGKIPSMNKENVDGEIAAFVYEGEGGTITLNLSTTGEMYIHGVKIVNTAETNYESQGNWYFVKPGDASSLIDVLEIVNGINASKDAERSFIYLPDGTYDLGETVKTAISGHNISIIGQSMDNTIIVSAPDKSIEGLGSADMFQSSGTNLYFQDVTLKNALDYYGALGGGQVGGRAAVIQDSGNRTIFKNVKMLSCQDTYYSSNDAMQSYFEDCDVHGTVDFICGGGDVRFQNTTISLEPRNANGTGGRTVVAPRGTVKFGYVFDGCTVVDLAEGKGDWNLGRTWNNQPVTVYLNTKLDENAAKTLVSSRWTQKGMNGTDPIVFGEYNTTDLEGNNITPASNSIASYGGNFETILSAEQAANYSYEMMFSENLEKQWDPAALTKQSAVPANLKLSGTTLTWDAANDGTIAWAVFKNGQLLAITDTPSYEVDDAAAQYAVRGANAMGGLGEAAATPVTIAVTSGYATFFDSKASYTLPRGLKAYVVTEATADNLVYTEVKDAIPAGTAVMLAGDTKNGKYTLTKTAEPVAPIELTNLLKGSDVATTTYADNDNSLFYKLAYGHSGTAQSKVLGWYWGANDGAAFEIEANRAWLAIPAEVASTRGYALDNDGTTGINAQTVGAKGKGMFYNLQGQRVDAPTKGVYIRDNKKVIIK